MPDMKLMTDWNYRIKKLAANYRESPNKVAPYFFVLSEQKVSLVDQWSGGHCNGHG